MKKKPASIPHFNIPLENLLNALTLISLWIFLALFFFRPIELDDVWWHLAVGKFIFVHRIVPQMDPFPFSTEQTPWVLTQWLGSCIYFLIFSIGGEWGLVVFRDFLFLLILGIFFYYARKKIPFLLLVLFIFILSLGLGTRCLLRPVTFNAIFIQIFLIVLLGYSKNIHSRKIFLLPLFGILWSNIHLGSFYCGALLIALFCFNEWLQFFGLTLEGLSTKNRSEKRLHLQKGKLLLGILIFYIFAFLINPYGLAGALHPWKVFLFPDYINFYKFSRIITEMQSPAYLFSVDGLWFFILLGGCVLALFFIKRNKLLLILLLAVSLAFFLYSQRNSDFFILVAAYIILEAPESISLKALWNSWPASKKLDCLFLSILLVILSAHILHLWNGKIILRGQIKKALCLKEVPTAPSAALLLLKDNKMNGRVFNNDSSGGYILWHSYPALRPFVDGRQANQKAFANYIQILMNPQDLWPDAQKTFQFDIAIIDSTSATNTKFLNHLVHNPDWQLIHSAGASVLFVKRGEFILPDRLSQLEKNLKTTSISIEEINETLKKYPPRIKSPFSIIKQFINPDPDYIDILDGGITLYDLGYKKAGLKYLLEAFKLTKSEAARYALSLALKDFKKITNLPSHP